MTPGSFRAAVQSLSFLPSHPYLCSFLDCHCCWRNVGGALGRRPGVLNIIPGGRGRGPSHFHESANVELGTWNLEQRERQRVP